MMMTETKKETCMRCGETLSPDAIAKGWPIATLESVYVCPSCYGDEAHCPEGHVLPATTDSGDCAECGDDGSDDEQTYTIELEGGECGDTEIEAYSLADAIEAAKEFARDGDWGLDAFDRGTIWISTCVRDAAGEVVWEGRVTVDPPEPRCDDDAEHDWQSPYAILGGIEENPGVQGHGGGVVVTEVCMRCGTTRTTDTWAQDPETGEQGLTSVSYEPGEYADEVREMREADESE